MRVWGGLVGIAAVAACGRVGFDAEAADAQVVRTCGPATATSVSVEAGERHACAIRDGALLCWGANDLGQLGLGDRIDRLAPTTVGVALDWTAVWIGLDHTCGNRAGTTWCWGANDHGQLGLGDTTARDLPNVLPDAWTTVSTGTAHTCAVRQNQLYCWGANESGQLGTGGTGPDVLAPTLISVNVMVNAMAPIASGDRHTCVMTGGRVFCWGDNQYGQLGDGTTTAHGTPAEVGTGTWVAMAGIGNHNCAVTNPGVNVFVFWCWGENGSSDFGLGDTTDRLSPAQLGFTGLAFAMGQSHALGKDFGTQVSAWGANDRGQIGLGAAAVGQTQPTPTVLPGQWESVDAGRRFSCAVDIAEALYCWGANDRGQLGLGTTADVPEPTRVCFPGE